MKPGELDAALAEVEAELPEGARLYLSKNSKGKWGAQMRGRRHTGAGGDTPAAALRALAAKLHVTPSERAAADIATWPKWLRDNLKPPTVHVENRPTPALESRPCRCPADEERAIGPICTMCGHSDHGRGDCRGLIWSAPVAP